MKYLPHLAIVFDQYLKLCWEAYKTLHNGQIALLLIPISLDTDATLSSSKRYN